MSVQKDRILFLFDRYTAGTITPAERQELFDFVNGGADLTFLKEKMDGNWDSYIPHLQLTQQESKTLLDRILGGEVQSVQPAPVPSAHVPSRSLPSGPLLFRPVLFMHKRAWIAAAVFVLLLAGLYGWFRYGQRHSDMTARLPPAQKPADIAPGRNGAILTLADGTRVVLDSLANGVIANQNGRRIMLNNKKLSYSGKAGAATVYNILSTPKGRQFAVQLPDGTGVWLNSASSIKYPTAFKDGRRQVEITGEVYFEVAKNPRMPFFVKINNTLELQVLGTHFNVNAYPEEKTINTTLLEGSVKITDRLSNIIVDRQQQAQFQTAAGDDDQPLFKVVKAVDIDKVMAWKNGLFDFEGVSLTEAMRQLERWYDIDVTYEKGVHDIKFFGQLRRDLPLSGILKALQYAEVNFRIDGRRLVVLP